MVLLARLVRIFRVLRLISIIPELRILISALIKALPPMGYVLLLMFIMFYIYAAVGSLLFDDINKVLWGDIAVSMLTLFRVVTFEDWTDVMYETMEVYPLSWMYYLSFIFLNAFVFLNMMIGIVIERMQAEQDAYDLAHDEGEVSELVHIHDDTKAILARLERLEERLISPSLEKRYFNSAHPSAFKAILKDLASGKVKNIQTRFPPEPNGYLHIGHAKSIVLNFGLAQKYNGKCNLRFDDTNPEKEEIEYVDSIKEDVEWLGYKWDGDVHFTSDYFDQLYDWAITLIKEGKAYVCDLNQEEMREYRGNLKEADGARALRIKVDMAHPNMQMRDPVIYRIKNMEHHQTGDKWHIYPSYDYAHGQGDAIEGVSHSVCTLEFVEHRPLYEWFIENLPVPSQPHQYEFSRLNVNYSVTSKRKLKQLVDENIVDGWDDPRMPTISGMRRRGFTPKSIRDFVESTGVTKVDGVVDVSQLRVCST
ncbi:Glutamine--tRNA ligase [Nymphon striatum]|nr:Glutamine--tRNA ligase [Nymphon striatum]